jgi:hypothetical protein
VQGDAKRVCASRLVQRSRVRGTRLWVRLGGAEIVARHAAVVALILRLLRLELMAPVMLELLIWSFFAWFFFFVAVEERQRIDYETPELKADWDKHHRKKRSDEIGMKTVLLILLALYLLWNHSCRSYWITNRFFCLEG